jgi:signal transduction histidine kinase
MIPSSPDANPQAVASQPRRTLLVVDDQIGPRQALSIVFDKQYNVLLAEDGPSALELVRRQTVDAVVLDIRMPGMSGIEVLQQLKEISPAVEVVMLTAYETVETARQALRLGACDYLTKPFDLETIRAAVWRAMERHSLAEQVCINREKLQELQQELHRQRVQERITRTKGDIYAGIVHDINNPLVVICGFLEMINQTLRDDCRIEGAELDSLRNDLAHISRQVNKCIEISQRYLSFIRQRSAKTSHVGINRLLDDLNHLLKVHPALRNHRLVFQPLETDAEAVINGTDLMQMLLNLVMNACQCEAKPHRVGIVARRLAEPLVLSALPDTDRSRFINREGFANRAPLISIAVADDGVGIQPEVLTRLFEPYFTTKSSEHGTGLGLSIIRRFIEEAEGGILVQTEPGQGTTFTLFLQEWQTVPAATGA